MKFLVFLFLFSTLTVAQDSYQKSQCYQKFKKHEQRYVKRTKRNLKYCQEAKGLGLIFSACSQSVTPDFEIGIVRAADGLFGSEQMKSLKEYVNHGPQKFYHRDIQKALQAGFKQEKFCGFLKGFGTVKRFVKKYLHNQAKAQDSSERNTASKEIELVKPQLKQEKVHQN